MTSKRPGPGIDLDRALADWPHQAPDVESAVRSIRARMASESELSAAAADALFTEPLPALANEDAEKTSASVRAVGFEGIEPPSLVTGAQKLSAVAANEQSKATRSEGSMTQQAERRRDRTSFQELAKMAQTPPPPSVSADAMPKSGPLSSPVASSPLVWPSSPSVGNVAGPASANPNSGPWSGTDSDSGMVDLKSIAQSDPNAADRAKATPLAAEGLFEDAAPPPASSAAPAVPPSSSAAAVSSAPAASAAPAVSAVTSVAPAVPQSAPKKKKSEGRGVVVVTLVAVLGAAAAAGFIVLKPRLQPVAAAPAPKAPEPVQVKPAEPPPAPVAAAPTPAEEAQPAAPAEPEPVANAKQAASKHGAKPGKPGAKLAAADSKEESAKVDPKDPNVAGFTGTLKAEMEKRAGGEKKGEEKVEVAQEVRGTQPKPSQGQVQGAIGAVLMKARECLGPDDPVSKANVVFGSSGAVQSVSVSGGAAGKPAEACIKAALGKAKVPAFADPTYSFPVTVRPL